MPPSSRTRATLLALPLCGCMDAGLVETAGAADGTAGASTGTTGGSAADTGDVADPPQVLAFEIVSVPENPLAVRARVQADRPVRVALDVRPVDAPSDAQPGTVTVGTLAAEHDVPVVGLHADAAYTFEVTVEDEAGASARAAADLVTAPLDPTLPPLAWSGASGEPGAWTFFNVMRWLGPAFDAGWGVVLGVDAAGHRVFVRFLERPGDVVWSGDGRFAVQTGTDGVVVMDATGATLAEYRAGELSPPIDTMHHEVVFLDEGAFATLSTEMRTIGGYDDGQGGTVAYDVVGDVLVEFDAAGTTRWRLSLFDVLGDAVYRVRPGFHAPFWDPVYGATAPSGTTKDWTHGNAMVYDGDRVLVSLRTQDWIVAVDRATGELIHRIGPEGDFTLVEGTWFYHQHAPEILPDGGLAVYDNGNTRPGTGGDGEPPRYSRMVVYDLDEQTMEASERFSHRADEGGYAPFLGDVDLRPDGSFLVTDGGLVADPTLDFRLPENTKFARICEVQTDGTTRACLAVGGPAAGTSFSVYRAERIEGGYGLAVSSAGRSTRRPRL